MEVRLLFTPLANLKILSGSRNIKEYDFDKVKTFHLLNSKIILVFSLFIFQNSYAQLNLELLGRLEYDPEINDVWGWVADNGDEYALVGAHTGLSIVNVTKPDQPEEVAFIDDVTSVWWDVKTWGNFAYVTNETGGGVFLVQICV